MSFRGKNLLILCEDIELFEMAEGYLAHKGLNTVLTTTVERFVEKTKSLNPDYAIVCVDHSDMYARKLLGIFQGSDISCIPTAETNDAESNKILDGINTEHILYPPVSGNRIEHILKYVESQKRKQMEKNAEVVDYTESDPSDSEGANLVYDEMASRLAEFIHNYSNVEKKSIQPTEIDLFEEQLETEYGLKIKPDSIGSLEENNVTESSEITSLPNGLVEDIWHLFDEAMHSVQGCSSIDINDKLNSVQNFIVYSIHGESVSGYVLAVIGGELNEENFNMLEKQFLNGLKNSIPGLDDIQKLELSMDPFDFSNWVLNEKGMLRTFELNKTTVSWGFIERPKMDLVLQASKNNDMVTVQLKDLHSGIKTKTDLYLHLPKNDKYILYTKEGESLMSEQVDRLEQKDIKDMHIKKDEVDKFKDYKVEKDITEMIKKQKAS